MNTISIGLGLLAVLAAAEKPTISYPTQIQPIFQKYCESCHNPTDREGKFSLANFADLIKGGEHGPAVTGGQPESSRLLSMLTGKLEPLMPPKDNAAPTAAEIDVIKLWIEQGAKGPDGKEPDRRMLIAPKIATKHKTNPITALAYSPDGKTLAVGRFRQVELLDANTKAVQSTIKDLPDKVTSLRFFDAGKQLAIGAGTTGLVGEARIVELATGQSRSFVEHRDVVFAAVPSHDGKLLATGSYDRTIKIWSLTDGKMLRTLAGHNDAVYDVAFSPDSKTLASASGDWTIKLWRVDSGERLDTFSQPTKEQYSVIYSPDGKLVYGAGVDNRVRVWKLGQLEKPQIHPLQVARFAHEGAVARIAVTRDGKRLISVSDDRTIKLWDARSMTQIHLYEPQPEVVAAIALAPTEPKFMVGRLDGSLGEYPLIETEPTTPTVAKSTRVIHGEAIAEDKIPLVDEVEPNNAASASQTITLPTRIKGVINSDGAASGDEDFFRFTAKQGEEWVIEVKAARDKSMLDSKLEVLDSVGKPVVRLLLRAVRDSYINFRGIDSTTRDVRVQNWQEMALNQYLYMQGEVCKLHQAPRGPDSGFKLYPHDGARHCYFDTSATAHAIYEPCYIVEPMAPGTKSIPNGLPTFPLYFENDDDGFRKLGKDSRVTFTVPADGEYVIRLRDVRGEQSKDHHYTLTVRPSHPDFKVTIDGMNLKIPVGSGRGLVVNVERMDGFEGPITVDIAGLPPGIFVTSPIVVEAGHNQANGVINALFDAPLPTKESLAGVKVTATAVIDGESIVKQVGNLGAIDLEPTPMLYLTLVAPDDKAPTLKRTWTPLTPTAADAEQGAKLTIAADGIVTATGPNADQEVYHVTLESKATVIGGLQLEALSEKSLPSGGPGRADGNGNFLLTEITVTAEPLDGSAPAQPVKLTRPIADYAQPGHAITNVIDGNPATGWAVAEEEKPKTPPMAPAPAKTKDEAKAARIAKNKFVVKKTAGDNSHTMSLLFAEPIAFPAGAKLVVTLRHESEAKGHNLGRFRLGLSTDLTPKLPDLTELTIAPGESIFADLHIDRIKFDQRVQFDDRNLPHGVIVDNIGLNGILIPEKQSKQRIMITATDWSPTADRYFHLEMQTSGRLATWPVLLHVRPKGAVAQK